MLRKFRFVHLVQLAGLLALVSVARAAWFLGNAEREIANSIYQVDRSVVLTLKSVGDILLTVRQAADAVRGSAGQEAVYWQGVSGRTTRILDQAERTVADLDGLVKQTNENLNASLLPEAADTLKSTDQAVSSTGTSIQLLSRDSHETLLATAQAAKNLAALSADPNILQSLQNLNSSTQELDRTMKNVAQASQESEAWVHKALTPASLLVRAAKFTANLAASFMGGWVARK
jgi:hypothetical protein